MRKKTLFITSLCLLIAMGAAAAYVYPSYRFLSELRDHTYAQQPGTSITKTEKYIPEADLNVHIYSPPQLGHSTLIVIPGMHPKGIHHSGYSSFLAVCANAGFQVVAPDMVEFRNFKINAQSVELIANLIKSLPQHLDPSTLENLGILGISYGAGPVFIAAARDDLKPHIDFIGSIGGYYNLLHAMDFALTGLHEVNGTVQFRSPHQWARMIFVANNIEKLAPSRDARILKESLLLRLQLQEQEAEKLEESLSADGKIFLQNVLTGLPPNEVVRFQATLTEYAELSKQISPESIVQRLDPKLRIYLLHGYADSLIPFTQTQQLSEALRQTHHANVHALISVVLSHVDPVQGSDSAWNSMNLLLWVRSFLNEAESVQS